MSMSKTVLGPALKAACTITPNPGESMDAFRARLFEAMAGAIIDHITANAVVNVASVSGVSTGVGVSGPGSGTIT